MPDCFIDPDHAQFDAFRALPRDVPIHMLNLVRFRDRAAYPADHALAGAGLSGGEAYAHYGRASGPIFERFGGRIVWRGSMAAMLIGPAGEYWDALFVGAYPRADAFLAMVSDPDYRVAVVHRQAAVATSRLIRCEPGDVDSRSGTAFG